MEFPQPPTDNLYKFMAISGIILIVISLIPFLHAHKLMLEIICHEGDVAILGKQIDWTTIDLNELKNDTEKLKQQVIELEEDTHKGLPKASTEDVELEAGEKIKEDLKDIIDKGLELKERLEKTKEINRKQEIANSNQKTKTRELKYLNTVFAYEFRAAKCAFVFGFFLAIMGFLLWYKKLQVFQDKIIQRKAKDGNAQSSGNGVDK